MPFYIYEERVALFEIEKFDALIPISPGGFQFIKSAFASGRPHIFDLLCKQRIENAILRADNIDFRLHNTFSCIGDFLCGAFFFYEYFFSLSVVIASVAAATGMVRTGRPTATGPPILT